jgi:hypothetical protein
MDNVQKTLLQITTDHRQNPLDFIYFINTRLSNKLRHTNLTQYNVSTKINDKLHLQTFQGRVI